MQRRRRRLRPPHRNAPRRYFDVCLRYQQAASTCTASWARVLAVAGRAVRRRRRRPRPSRGRVCRCGFWSGCVCARARACVRTCVRACVRLCVSVSVRVCVRLCVYPSAQYHGVARAAVGTPTQPQARARMHAARQPPPTSCCTCYYTSYYTSQSKKNSCCARTHAARQPTLTSHYTWTVAGPADGRADGCGYTNHNYHTSHAYNRCMHIVIYTDAIALACWCDG